MTVIVKDPVTGRATVEVIVVAGSMHQADRLYGDTYKTASRARAMGVSTNEPPTASLRKVDADRIMWAEGWESGDYASEVASVILAKLRRGGRA